MSNNQSDASQGKGENPFSSVINDQDDSSQQSISSSETSKPEQVTRNQTTSSSRGGYQQNPQAAFPFDEVEQKALYVHEDSANILDKLYAQVQAQAIDQHGEKIAKREVHQALIESIESEIDHDQITEHVINNRKETNE